jgi:hypothetical protein
VGVPRSLLAVLATVTGAALLGPPVASARVPASAVVLPGDAAAAGLAADGATWLVAGRPGAATAAVARRYGARRAGHLAWEVDRDRARRFAAALRRRGLLVFAESNRLSRRSQAVADPLSTAPPWPGGWRAAVVDEGLVPPVVADTSPQLALIDSQIDLSHPEFTGAAVRTLGSGPPLNIHGTATGAVAAAPVNGIGIVGVWPGMRAVNVPLPADRIRCSDSARGIARAVADGATVLNMSYGSARFCRAEFVELQLATAAGVTALAASGNEFTQGNLPQFPASLPHVITVGAVDPRRKQAFFSSTSAAVDVSAPGEAIITAVPIALDLEDGVQDGYQSLDGTSFAAPIVAAAATWLRAARPDLSPDQVANVLRLSAVDLGRKGWDASTGFGLVNVARALAQRAPERDPAEPNDDMEWVDGRAFERPAPAIYRGGPPTRLRALLDRFEDPDDVYRVIVPARTRLTVTVKPRFGDPDLAIYDGSARSVRARRHRLGTSERRGLRTDRLRVGNTSGRARRAYVHVFVDPRARTLDSAYRLTIRRG